MAGLPVGALVLGPGAELPGLRLGPLIALSRIVLRFGLRLLAVLLRGNLALLLHPLLVDLRLAPCLRLRALLGLAVHSLVVLPLVVLLRAVLLRCRLLGPVLLGNGLRALGL